MENTYASYVVPNNNVMAIPNNIVPNNVIPVTNNIQPSNSVVATKYDTSNNSGSGSGLSWLPWVNLVLIIIIILIFLISYFFTGSSGLVNGVNYDIVELNSKTANVTLPTGTNSMGISAPTLEQTVTILANSFNKKGLTIAIKNNTSSGKNITIKAGTGVTIDEGGLGDLVEPGELAQYIVTSNTNSFLRL